MIKGGIFLLLVSVMPLFAQNKTNKLDAVLQSYYDSGKFNGVVLVAENSKIILEKGYGYSNIEWNNLNDPETKFKIGSMNKQFIAMAIIKLFEEGKLNLDGKISEYLPNFRKDIGNKVTIHQLLTHSSGIPWLINYSDFAKNTNSLGETIEKVCSNDLEFEPGTKFKYSTSGYFILAAIVEKVSGIRYIDYIKKNILDPLGMINSTFDLPEIIIKKRASGYGKDSLGYFNRGYSNIDNWGVTFGLYTTVGDLFLWDQALYEGKLISQHGYDMIFSHQIKASEEDEVPEWYYGYGWWITDEFAIGDLKKKLIDHSGGDIGFNATIKRFVDDKNTIIILSNFSGIRDVIEDLVLKISYILYDQPN